MVNPGFDVELPEGVRWLINRQRHYINIEVLRSSNWVQRLHWRRNTSKLYLRRCTLFLSMELSWTISASWSLLLEDWIIFTVVFYTLVLISALTLMNILIGILCGVVSAVTTTERQELTGTYVKASLR